MPLKNDYVLLYRDNCRDFTVAQQSAHHSQNARFCFLAQIFQQSDGNKGDVDMSGLGVNTVKSAAGRSIKYASIILIHFLSVVACLTWPEKANTVTASMQTLMEQAPGGKCNYGFSSVSLTVMHTDETALWPSLCPTQRVFRLRAPL